MMYKPLGLDLTIPACVRCKLNSFRTYWFRTFTITDWYLPVWLKAKLVFQQLAGITTICNVQTAVVSQNTLGMNNKYR